MSQSAQLTAFFGGPVRARSIGSWYVIGAAILAALSFWITPWWTDWVRWAVTVVCVAMIGTELRHTED
ncbi:hypothetical protein [Nocardia sp. NPDC004722]